MCEFCGRVVWVLMVRFRDERIRDGMRELVFARRENILRVMLCCCLSRTLRFVKEKFGDGRLLPHLVIS